MDGKAPPPQRRLTLTCRYRSCRLVLQFPAGTRRRRQGPPGPFAVASKAALPKTAPLVSARLRASAKFSSSAQGFLKLSLRGLSDCDRVGAGGTHWTVAARVRA